MPWSSPWARGLGWTVLYACSLWGLWLVLAQVGQHADNPDTTRGYWVLAVLVPFALALIGALGTEAGWWVAIPPLVISLSLLALAVTAWRHPSLIPTTLTSPVVADLPSPGTTPVWVLFLALVVLASLLASGVACIGRWTSRYVTESARRSLREGARWLLIGVPLVTFGLVSGEGVAVGLGFVALSLAMNAVGLVGYWWPF
jgi:hypothetical protein